MTEIFQIIRKSDERPFLVLASNIEMAISILIKLGKIKSFESVRASSSYVPSTPSKSLNDLITSDKKGLLFISLLEEPKFTEVFI